mmetsp:Transcript_122518/g.342886  ORF Transcript_122518/g.342886 Transcript_122518/m.342886 type:complete len:269 (+) Transcript_122518:220-1026(+)
MGDGALPRPKLPECSKSASSATGSKMSTSGIPIPNRFRRYGVCPTASLLHRQKSKIVPQLLRIFFWAHKQHRPGHGFIRDGLCHSKSCLDLRNVDAGHSKNYYILGVPVTGRALTIEGLPRQTVNRPLGVRVFRAYSGSFGLLRNPQGIANLALTVDLRAKVLRTKSVLEQLCEDKKPAEYRPTAPEISRAQRRWIGEVVITMYDKKCYSVTDLLFEHSAVSMQVEGLGMSHAEYFSKRKGITLKSPNAYQCWQFSRVEAESFICHLS